MKASSVSRIDPCHISASLFLPRHCTNMAEVILEKVSLLICLPRQIPAVFICHTFLCFICYGCYIICWDWCLGVSCCVSSMLCNTTHVKSFRDFSHYLIPDLVGEGLCSLSHRFLYFNIFCTQSAYITY